MSKLYTLESPLGPIDAEPVDPSVEEMLKITDYSLDSFRIYARSSALILGRKGGGKTSFMRSSMFYDQNGIFIFGPQDKDFANVLKKSTSLLEA